MSIIINKKIVRLTKEELKEYKFPENPNYDGSNQSIIGGVSIASFTVPLKA